MQVAEKHQAARLWPRLTGWSRAALPVALLFLISVALFWKLILTDQYTWLEGPDLARQVLPWFQFQAGEWHTGHPFPLWDPNQWLGQPLIGQAQPGAAYPPNWLLFMVPLRHGWLRQTALNWYFVLARFLAALFMYLLCRDLQRSRLAAVVAGCAFAFSGYVATTDWPQMFNGAIWIPLVFLFLLRSARRQRPWSSAALGGFFLGISWLSGHHQVPIFVSVSAGFVWLYFIFRARKPDWRMAGAAMLFFAMTFCAGGLQILPAIEYGRHAFRWTSFPDPLPWDTKVPYVVHDEYSMKPSDLLGILVPSMNGYTVAYMGTAAISLAVLAALASFQQLYVRLFLTLGLGGLCLALGSNTPLHGVLYALVPIVEKARAPSMGVVIFNFSFAVLAGYGIDSLSRYSIRRATALAALIFGAGILALTSASHILHLPNPDDRTVLAAAYALAVGAALASTLRPTLVARILSVLVLGELGMICGHEFRTNYGTAGPRYLKNIPQSADIVDFLRTREQPLRVDVDERVIPINFGDWYGVEQLQGYLASVSDNLYHQELHTRRAQQLMSVRYSIGREPKWQDQTLIFENPIGLRVYESPGVLPRVRVVRQFRRLFTTAQIVHFISAPEVDLASKAALLEQPPATGACDGSLDDIRLIRHDSGRVTIRGKLQCKGMVILADTYFPGWTAYVDGQQTKIYEPYGCLRGVVVDGGDHTIEMVYRPWSVLAGGALSLLGLVTVLTLAWCERR